MPPVTLIPRHGPSPAATAPIPVLNASLGERRPAVGSLVMLAALSLLAVSCSRNTQPPISRPAVDEPTPDPAQPQTLGVGTTALIAHATGRKDPGAARLVFNQSQVLSLVVGMLFFVVMMALRGWFARVQSADPETARLAGEYLTWFIPALAGQFAMIATASALRGIGDFKPGMIMQTATVVLNAGLAPVTARASPSFLSVTEK